jgi:hypothetical protein
LVQVPGGRHQSRSQTPASATQFIDRKVVQLNDEKDNRTFAKVGNASAVDFFGIPSNALCEYLPQRTAAYS